MATNGNGHHDKTVVVLQLSGGNDALNTVIPYNDGQYYDNRPFVNIPQDKVLKLDDKLGLNPALAPIKELWDDGKVALINGVGYPSPNRSHFRSMDVWHTAESEQVGDEGWLGRAIRELDPKAENVLTGVNFGRGLPRALYAKGVPVASVGNLETYGCSPTSRTKRRATSRSKPSPRCTAAVGAISSPTLSRRQARTHSRARTYCESPRSATPPASSTPTTPSQKT